MLLYLRFCIYNHDKFIRLTVLNCARTATQNIIFTVVYFDTFFCKINSAPVACTFSGFTCTQLLVALWMQPTRKFTTQFSGKDHHAHCPGSCKFLSLSLITFLLISLLKYNLHRKFERSFFLRCTIKASACKITWAKTKDSAIVSFPAQTAFEGFPLNS